MNNQIVCQTCFTRRCQNDEAKRYKNDRFRHLSEKGNVQKDLAECRFVAPFSMVGSMINDKSKNVLFLKLELS